MKKNTCFAMFIMTLFMIFNEANAQKFNGIIGAFEFSGDIYISYQNEGSKRFLSKKVEGYLSADVLASTILAPVDVIYSTKHQRIYAIYQTNSKKFVAHAIHSVDENSSPNVRLGFGIIIDPSSNRTMAVYLNSDDNIVGFPLN